MKSLAGIFVLAFFNNVVSAQVNWQHKDLAKDSVFGISTEKAYSELLKNKKPKKVIVAIIDSGIDTLHEDLKSVLWTDAKTGIHGWNYIGAETGKEDVTQLVGNKKEFYDSLSFTLVPEVYRAGYQQYRKMEPALSDKLRGMNVIIERLERTKYVIDEMVKKIGKDQPTVEDFMTYKPVSDDEGKLIRQIVERFAFYKSWNELKFFEIDNLINLAQYHITHGLNINNNENDTASGNANIFPDALGLAFPVNYTPIHGTHVAGIIGAERNNGKGIDGIADNVQLMMLKANGNIRELRDKSLANAIRFAVDHGAQIINLSFGKPYTWDKKSVDDAIAYAKKKDVLLVHAAGNNGQNVDVAPNYPNPADKSNWIEVGASGPKDDNTLAASFSNYGKSSVDVFAPGVQINSCIPGSKYEEESGTSMATPVVVGVAALLREYYPNLKAIQIKEIITKTVIKREVLRDKCISGGVVNVYNALKLAGTYK
jgi:subtilisin family serine protease